MADETFRPQNNREPENELEGNMNNFQQENPEMPQGLPAPPETFQVTGNIPQQWLDKMQQAKAVKEGYSEPQVGFSKKQPAEQNQFSRKTKDKGFDEYGFRRQIGGSDHLKELLGGLKETTSVYETIMLPSKGRFYDGEDGPADGMLNLRPMTGEEEQILATPRFVKKGSAINMIFQRCIREKFNPDNFLTIDRTYILIYLRGTSYTHEYDVEVKCPDTDRKFSTTIDLNSLYVEPCPDDFGPELTDVMPTSGYRFKYRLSRGRDEREAQEYRERRVKIIGEDVADDTLLHRTALLLDNVEGLEDKGELQELLRRLPINDVSYIRGCINEPPFGIETNVTILSPYTMEEFDIELPLESNFFFPRRKKKA